MFLAWVGAIVVFHIASAGIHLLLVLALVFLVMYLFNWRRTV